MEDGKNESRKERKNTKINALKNSSSLPCLLFLFFSQAEGVRPDGRELWQFRKTVLNVGAVSTADGSSLVKIGETSVMCGIKAELTNPPLENPDVGWVVSLRACVPACLGQPNVGACICRRA